MCQESHVGSWLKSEVRAAPAHGSLASPWPQTLSRPLFWTNFSSLLIPSRLLQLFLGLYVSCCLFLKSFISVLLQ